MCQIKSVTIFRLILWVVVTITGNMGLCLGLDLSFSNSEVHRTYICSQ